MLICRSSYPTDLRKLGADLVWAESMYHCLMLQVFIPALMILQNVQFSITGAPSMHTFFDAYSPFQKLSLL